MISRVSGVCVAALVARLNDALRKIAEQADTRAFYAKLGAELAPSTPEALAAILRREVEKWTKISKDIGLAVD